MGSSAKVNEKITLASPEYCTIQTPKAKSSPDKEMPDDAPPSSASSPPRIVSFRKLFTFADNLDKFLLVIGTIAGIMTGVAQPLQIIAFGDVVNAFNGDATNTAMLQEEINSVVLYFVYLAVAVTVTGCTQVVCYTLSSTRQIRRLRKEYIRAIMRQEIGWFDVTKPSSLATQVADKSLAIQDGIGRKAGDGFQFAGMAVAGITIAIVKGWELGLSLLAFTPIIALSTIYMMKSMEKAVSEGGAAYATAGGIAAEALSNIRTVHALNASEKMKQRYADALHSTEKSAIAKGLAIGIGTGMMFCTIYITYAFGLYYGAVLVSEDKLANCVGSSCYDGGRVLIVFFSAITGAMAIGQAGPSLQAIFTARAAAVEVYDVIERPSKIDASSPDGVMLPATVKGTLTFTDVTFHYPARPEIPVCDHLTLDIRAGETVALVGPSGSGKSTIVSLLERFYDPDVGNITLDGIALTSLNVTSLRQAMGLVGQEPVLFKATIGENIGAGKQGATLEEIHDAAKAANAYDFIMQLSNGFDTQVGERGIQISGGQKQRIAIARAIIKDPAVLLLDEATSALDTESERIVQASLDALVAARQRTTIIIAHRLSTIRNVDRILVMEAGAVVESGSHTELMALPGGKYATLVAAVPQNNTLETIEEEASLVTKGDATILSATNTSFVMPVFAFAIGQTVLIDATAASRDKDPRSSLAEELVVQDVAVESILKPLSREASTHVSSERVSHKVSQVIVTPVRGIIRGRHYPSSGSTLVSYTVALLTSTEKNHPSASLPSGVYVEAEMTLETVETIEEKDALVAVPLSRIWKMSKPDGWYILMGVIGAALNGASFPIWGLLLTKATVTYFLPPEDMKSEALWWSFGFVALGLIFLLALVMQCYGFAIVAERLTTRIRVAGFQAMLRQNMGWFDADAHTSGALVTQLASDSAIVQSMTAEMLNRNVATFFTLVVAFSIAFYYSWKFTLVLVAVFPFLAFASYIQMAQINGTGNVAENGRADIDAGAVLSESVMNMRTIAAFTMEDARQEMYRAFLQVSKNRDTKVAFLSGLGFGISQGLMFAVQGFLFYIGGLLVTDGQLNFESMFMVLLAVLLSTFGLGTAFQTVTDAAKAKRACSNLFSVIDRIPEINAESTEGFIPPPQDSVGKIELNQVDFSYPTRIHLPVCWDYNLVIERGQTVALVGASGGGKSTIIALLERFYDPLGGAITLDTRPLDSLNLAWLRSKISLVGQEPALFSGTIAENIGYGKPLATLAEIRAALSAANALDFVLAFPEGLETQVGDRGIQVSGGQKQRLALARAIISDPEVLLLDEATSALDTESERVVQASLEALLKAKKRTTIVIAHRLSTIREADVIAVVSNGTIVELGTHELLMGRENGHYRALVGHQQLES